jgi:hypothetical protein
MRVLFKVIFMIQSISMFSDNEFSVKIENGIVEYRIDDTIVSKAEYESKGGPSVETLRARFEQEMACSQRELQASLAQIAKNIIPPVPPVIIPPVIIPPIPPVNIQPVRFPKGFPFN